MKDQILRSKRGVQKIEARLNYGERDKGSRAKFNTKVRARTVLWLGIAAEQQILVLIDENPWRSLVPVHDL